MSHKSFALLLAALVLSYAAFAADLKVYQARKVAAPPTAIGPVAAIMDAFTDGATDKLAAVQTRAQAAYDGEGLYFVVECLEPKMKALRAKATGQKDANIFADDCIEIFVCPAGSEKEYYHFGANSRGARFDEKVKARKWAGKWTVEATTAADRWTLVFAIPFADLKAKPQRGAVWWFNVDRQRHAGGKLELSSWSPTGQNFHSVRHFGRMVFDNDYAACLSANVIEPWDKAMPALRKRAKIDAAAAKQLEARIAAMQKLLAPVRTTKPKSLAELATLLAAGMDARRQLDAAAQELHETVSKIEVGQAMVKLARPGQKLLAYAVRPITNVHILPTPAPPKQVSTTLKLRACRGELEPASFVVYPFDKLTIDKVVASDLSGPQGKIPASAVDIRSVKCWYQSGGTGRFPLNKGLRLLTPELLLKDDDLVKVDYEKKENYVKLSFPNGTRKWLWVSSPKRTRDEARIATEEQPIYDAKTLQPVSLPARHAKQFWVTVHVPQDTAAGRYAGKVDIMSGGQRLESLKLEVVVLPFDLAANPLESSMYFHWGMDLDVSGKGTVRYRKRSVVQYKAELANLVAHGVDNPTLGVRYKSGLLGLALWLRKEAGMKTDRLYYLIARAESPTEDIKKIIEIAKQFGYEDVYFYGRDEVRGEKLLAQREAWERLHETGGKVFVAGSAGHNFPSMGDLQDLLVCYGDPSKEEAALWHSKGHKIFSYANPQSGIEEPETYRRNFGLLLAANNYDGGMTYIFYHGWNDFTGKRYRQHNFVYPTADGLVDTIQWEGYREGIDDLRYLGTLRNAIAAAQKAGGAQAKLAAQAQAFLDSMDVTGDLYAIREQMIDWTLKLGESQGHQTK